MFSLKTTYLFFLRKYLNFVNFFTFILTVKDRQITIIGVSNVGIDLLLKIECSPFLEGSLITSRSLESTGVVLTRSKGIPVSDQSIQTIEQAPTCCDIVFDAISVSVYIKYAPILKKMKKFTVGLIPAKVGRFCVPVLNLDYCLTVNNVNMVTCGGQVIVSITKAMTDVHPEALYIETVPTIASKYAGMMGTWENIDEFTQAIKDTLVYFPKASCIKSIILLSPAEPPVIMRSMYYIGMLGITSHSKIPLRVAFFGFFLSGVSLLVAIGYLTVKLLFWNIFMLGLTPLVIGVFLGFGTVIFYRPLVIEDK